MKSRTRLFGVAAAFAAATFSFQALADVVVGIAVPSHGSKAGLGRAIVADAKALISGGTGLRSGETLRVEIADDGCTADGGEQAAKAFAAARVALVIGHPCSNAAVAAAKIYAAAQIYFVAIGATHPHLTSKRAGPTIFRNGGRDDRQAEDTASALIEAATGPGIAIIHDRTAYAKALAEGVTQQLLAKGRTGITQAAIVAGEKDFPDLAAKLIRARPSLVYFAGFPAEARILARLVRRSLGNDVLFAGSDAVIGPDDRVPAESGVRLPATSASMWAMTPLQPQQAGATISAWLRVYDQYGPSVAPEHMAEALKADASGDRIGRSYALMPIPAR